MAAVCPASRLMGTAGFATTVGGRGRCPSGASATLGGGQREGHYGRKMTTSLASNFFKNYRLGGISHGSGKRLQATRGRGGDGARAFATADGEKVNAPYRWPNSTGPRICILGGGFGGLYTALRLESLTWIPDKRPQVLLIDQSDRFVFKPMLYEILSKEVDPWEIAPTYSELLADTSIKFVNDSVKAVSPSDSAAGKLSPASNGAGGTVYLDGGAQIDYDWLVLALGAESRLGLVSGALQYALPFGTLDDALEVDRRLVALERERLEQEGVPIEVVIVGSGYSGIELAATLAERLGKKGNVQVVDPNPAICASAPVGNREVASKVLSSRGVKLDLGYFVTNINESTVGETGFEGNGSVPVKAPRRLLVEMELAGQRQTARRKGGRKITADLILWTIGNKAAVPPRPHAEDGAFPVNGRGQADTDETLRVKGHPRIFAIGDAAGAKDSSGKLLPATAQVAFQQADYAGWNLWAAINDRPLLPFRYQHLGEMMTLGTSDAAVTLGFVDFTLDGILGHSVRKLAYLYRFPRADHRAKVALSWLAKSTLGTISFIQEEFAKVVDSR